MAALTRSMKLKVIPGALALAQQVAKFPASKLWLDHDTEADVLCISFQRPQKASETVELDEEGMLLHYRGKKLVGITVLDVSRRGT